MDRRLRQNAVIITFSLIVFLSVWQIITGPGPPNLLQSVNRDQSNVINSENTTTIYSSGNLIPYDFSQLIDINNFSFTIYNSVCNKTNPYLIILVHTAPTNFAKRKTIRETWGQKMQDIQLLFMLGQVHNNTLQAELEKENEEYNDFIQGTFLDSYRNVTYKHAMVFKYVIYHCNHAKYVLKTDDDIFINTFTLIQFLKDEFSPQGVSNLLFCIKQDRPIAIRSYRSKWRVSFKEYPNKYYPPFCPGWLLIYSSDLVFKLYKELQNVRPYFWIDDVLITGILFEKLGLVHYQNTNSITKDEQNDIVYHDKNSTTKPFLNGNPQLTEYEIRRLWDYVVNRHLQNQSKQIQI